MTDPVTIAMISGISGALTAFLGKTGYDRLTDRATEQSESFQDVIDRRASLEAQTRMELMMKNLTHAIEKGNDRAIDRMDLVSRAISSAAEAIRSVHQEIQEHRRETKEAVGASIATYETVEHWKTHGVPVER